MQTQLCLVAACSLLLACRGPAPSARGRGTAGKSSQASEQLVLQRGIALSAPGGDTKTDHLITQLQARISRDPEKLDTWVQLARSWIRKAREGSEPSLYANAEACAAMALTL